MKEIEAKRASEARIEAETPQRWTGYYKQGGIEHTMNIEELTVDFISGRIHGEGEDGIGGFDFDGTITGNTFEFVKQYRGAHSINYAGEFEGQETMVGHWGSEKGEKIDEFKISR